MLGWDAAAMMPPRRRRGARRPARRAGRPRAWPADRPRGRRRPRRPTGGADRPLARRQPAPDAPRPCPRHRPAGRPGRGASARQLRLREDLARRPPRRRLRPCRARTAEVLGLVREHAAALSAALGLSPYDALMDGYQRGIVTADVAPCSTATRLSWPTPCRGRGAPAPRPPPIRLSGPFPPTRRKSSAAAWPSGPGLDFNHARLDRSRTRSAAARRTTCASPCATTSTTPRRP